MLRVRGGEMAAWFRSEGYAHIDVADVNEACIREVRERASGI